MITLTGVDLYNVLGAQATRMLTVQTEGAWVNTSYAAGVLQCAVNGL